MWLLCITVIPFVASLAGLFLPEIVAVPAVTVLIYVLFRKKLDPDETAKANGIAFLALLAVLTVVTGMFWARRSWGVWWTWDPRLSTALVMCFAYAALLILRGLDMPHERRRQICAVTGIVAFLDVPLVFVSARIWRSIHPAVFASKDGGLAPEMKYTAIACTICFGLLWLALLVWRNRQLACADRIEKLAGRGD